MTAPGIAPRRGQFIEPSPITAANIGEQRISILDQGESGGGKTHFICTMPQPIIVGQTDPNMAVINGFIQGGANITVYPLTTWAEFEWFVRKTKCREWNAATVALDSYTFMGDRLVLEKMDDPSSTKSDGNLKLQVWNHVKNDQWQVVMDLVGATSPIAGKPAYHVVVTIHEREEYEKTLVPGATGEAQFLSKLVGVNPSVPGGLREGFGRMFDCVFIAQERPRTEKQTNGSMRVVGSEHLLWTVPPDHLRHTKDGVGGKAGRKALPPTVENTWTALCAAWGVDPLTMKAL